MLKVWVIHWGYIDMYDSKGGRKDLNLISIFKNILTYFHHPSFPPFLLGIVDKWVAFEIWRTRMAPRSKA